MYHSKPERLFVEKSGRKTRYWLAKAILVRQLGAAFCRSARHPLPHSAAQCPALFGPHGGLPVWMSLLLVSPFDAKSAELALQSPSVDLQQLCHCGDVPVLSKKSLDVLHLKLPQRERNRIFGGAYQIGLGSDKRRSAFRKRGTRIVFGPGLWISFVSLLSQAAKRVFGEHSLQQRTVERLTGLCIG